jgi:hypothetical protein
MFNGGEQLDIVGFAGRAGFRPFQHVETGDAHVVRGTAVAAVKGMPLI